MRNLYFIFMAITMFVSCRSIEKMVESGNYDEAFEFAIDKLAGKKNKETKYVKGLEKAFDELQARDESRIAYLLQMPHDHLWSEIASTYERMNRRQNVLRPILPLVSEDGYRARFTFNDYSADIANAKNKAAKYTFDNAMEMIKDAEDGDKFAAQKAYELFAEVMKFDPNFENAREMRSLAYDLGLEHYGIEFLVTAPGRSRAALDAEISRFNISGYNTFWRKYHRIDAFNESDFDGIFSVSVDDIDFGTEREFVNQFDVEKIITEGFRPVLDNNGVAMKDSLGNVIKEAHKVKVKAFVSEIRREKNAVLVGSIRYFAQNMDYAASTTPIQVNFNFSDNAADFRGDVRALDQNLVNLTKKRLLAFPDAYDVTSILGDKFFDEVKRRIPNIRIYQA